MIDGRTRTRDRRLAIPTACYESSNVERTTDEKEKEEEFMQLVVVFFFLYSIEHDDGREGEERREP